jgi:hypothetical protein
MGDHQCYDFNYGVSNNRQRLLEEWERHIFILEEWESGLEESQWMTILPKIVVRIFAAHCSTGFYTPS